MSDLERMVRHLLCIFTLSAVALGCTSASNRTTVYSAPTGMEWSISTQSERRGAVSLLVDGEAIASTGAAYPGHGLSTTTGTYHGQPFSINCGRVGSGCVVFAGGMLLETPSVDVDNQAFSTVVSDDAL